MDSDRMREMAESCMAMMDQMTQMMQMHERMPMGQEQDAMAAAASMGTMMSSGAMSAMPGGLWILLAAGLLLAVGGLALWMRRPAAAGTAVAQLERRYVRGQIGRDEYLAMRADLTG